MSSVPQVTDYGYVFNGYNKAPMQAQTMGSEKRPQNSGIIDCTNLYTQKEIKNILNKIGNLSPDLPAAMYVPRYTVQYFPKSDTLVINNVSRTNDTTEILSDGSVHSVGSWHNKEVAAPGSFNDVLDDAKNRIKVALTH